MTDLSRLPRVASIATMPSRMETFENVFRIIQGQVDHFYIYLDGFAGMPAFLEGAEKVTVRRAEEVGNLHASSRFLCLGELDEPALVVVVDDDIFYPPDYVEQLARFVQWSEGNAIIGVHGRVFLPPHRSYVKHAMLIHFSALLAKPRHVHEIGAGTCAFVSDRFPVDPVLWDRNDMDDVMVALEAQERGLPRIIIPRQADWVRPQGQHQTDSLWDRTGKDDSEQSRRMRVLLGLYDQSSADRESS